MSENYYELLNLDVSASAAEIKTAWRRQLKLYHPDRFVQQPEQREVAERYTKQLNEAYRILNDPIERQIYDAQRGTLREPDPYARRPSAGSGRRDFQALLKRAWLHLERRQYELAYAEFETIARRNPQSAEAHLGMGEVLILMGSLQEGINLLSLAANLDPDLADAHLWLGAAFRQAQQHYPAMRSYLRACRLLPQSVDAVRGLLELVREEISVDEPLKGETLRNLSASIEYLVCRYPGDRKLLLGLGQLRLVQGRSEEAVQALRTLSNGTPPNALLRGLLGQAYEGAGQVEEAVKTLRWALRLDPEAAEVRQRLIRCLRQGLPDVGDPIPRAQAIAPVLAELVSLEPSRADEYTTHAVEIIDYYPAQSGALEQVALALDGIAQKGDGAFLRGLLAMDAGNLSQATRYLEIALRNQVGDRAEAAYRLGLCQMRLDDLQEAAIWYERALGIQRNHPSAHIALGDICQIRGEYDDAAQHFEAALRVLRDHPEVHLRLANLYHSQGQLDLARTHYEHTLTADPDHKEALYRLALVQAKAGEPSEALRLLQHLLVLAPSHSQAQDALYHLHAWQRS
ncbi:MAG: tetratricopeptide repeat protein [Chloroflexi bacterium]|nr:tetratricopeptide repeat protein [Chloroflexota bacterium]